MRVVTHRVGRLVLAPALVAGVAMVWAVVLPSAAGASAPAGPEPAGASAAPVEPGGAVLGPAVAYLREADGTVRRIR